MKEEEAHLASQPTDRSVPNPAGVARSLQSSWRAERGSNVDFLLPTYPVPDARPTQVDLDCICLC
jgi:hypothetical protein